MAPFLHPDAEAIVSKLQKGGIRGLYHHTNVDNLPSICRTQALYSKEVLERLGLLSTTVTGGEGPSHELDRRYGNWDKFALSLTPYTPMAFRRKEKQHLCFFVVPIEIAGWSGVTFTDSNATATGHRRDEGLIGLDNLDLDILSGRSFGYNPNWKWFIQAEALVPNEIPLDYVHEVVFVSQASKAHAERLLGTLPHPRFSVDHRIFASKPLPPSIIASREAIKFPFVVELLLTDRKVDPNDIELLHAYKSRYYKGHDTHITVIALVRALSGAKGEIRLLPFGAAKSYEFMKTEEIYHISPPISVEKLKPGAYAVEYYLNNICWASTDFEVAEM